jgi:hypothetical protein
MITGYQNILKFIYFEILKFKIFCQSLPYKEMFPFKEISKYEILNFAKKMIWHFWSKRYTIDTGVDYHVNAVLILFFVLLNAISYFFGINKSMARLVHPIVRGRFIYVLIIFIFYCMGRSLMLRNFVYY